MFSIFTKNVLKTRKQLRENKVELANKMEMPKNPFELFPEEIWRMVWGNLTHPQGNLSLVQSHPTLENTFTFQNGKMNWLFPLVLPNILDYMKATLYLKTPRLVRQTMFNLRLVSSRCCSAIEKYKDEECEREKDPLICYCFTYGIFNRGTRVQDFLRMTALQPPERNKMLCLSKCFTASVSDVNGIDPTPQEILALGEKLAPHLRQVCLIILSMGVQEARRFISQMLAFNPDVKYLCLQFLDRRRLVEVDEDEEPENPEQIIQLPTLPKLNNVYFCGNGIVKVFAGINLNKTLFRNISFLQIDFFIVKRLCSKVEGDENFPNLKSLTFLEIHSCSSDRDITSEMLVKLPLISNSPNLNMFEWEAVHRGSYSKEDLKPIDELTKAAIWKFKKKHLYLYEDHCMKISTDIRPLPESDGWRIRKIFEKGESINLDTIKFPSGIERIKINQ